MFGLSFGASHDSSKSTSNVTKDETGSQVGNEFTLGSKTGTQSTTGSTTNTAAGTSTTTGTSNQATTQTGTQQQTGTTRNLSAETTGGLEGAVHALLTQILDPKVGDRAMLTRGLGAMGDFNVDEYVNGTLQAAKATQGTKLDEILGSIFSRGGSAEGNNSMETLLANRARGDAAANLAGVEAQARGAGAQIAQGGVNAISTAMAAASAQLPAILNALKGATTTTEQSSLLSQIEKLVGAQGSQTATTEASAQQTAGQQTSAETLAQLISNIVNTQSHTTGTETTKGSNTKIGGGLSLSI